MDIFELIRGYLCFVLIFAILVGGIARDKGRSDFQRWFILGLLLGPIAIIPVLKLPKANRATQIAKAKEKWLKGS